MLQWYAVWIGTRFKASDQGMKFRVVTIRPSEQRSCWIQKRLHCSVCQVVTWCNSVNKTRNKISFVWGGHKNSTFSWIRAKNLEHEHHITLTHHLSICNDFVHFLSCCEAMTVHTRWLNLWDVTEKPCVFDSSVTQNAFTLANWCWQHIFTYKN